MGRKLSLWGPVVAWMGVLFYASSQSDVGGFGRIPDWITHGSVYLILSLLVCRALAGGLLAAPGAAQGLPAAPSPAQGLLLPLSARAALLAISLSTAYGVSDEYHQSFVPGRDASAGDVAKDLGGATIGALLFWRGAGGALRRGVEVSR